MTRLSGSETPVASPLGAFADDLRALRDGMGAGAPTIDEVSRATGLPRSTLYSALKGRRLPRREVVAALATAWGGDEAEWLGRRSAVERQLATGGTTSTRRPFRAVLSPQSVDLLRSAGLRRYYQQGEVLFAEGQEAIGACLIEDGVVKVSAAGPLGHSVLLAIRGPGEDLGMEAVLDSRPHAGTVVALTQVKVTMVPASALAGLLMKAPQVTLDIARVFSKRLTEAARARVDALASVDSRVVSFLQSLGERFGTVRPDGALEIPRFINQAEMAEALELSRESVVRALSRLRESGALKTGPGRLMVLCVDEDRAQRDAEHGLG
jgi:CRP/FNR family transcriptional regulator, cyclic AMP receptor protein